MRAMKLVIALAAIAGIGAIVAVITVGRRYAEPTVVADPYEAGLHYDEQHHARDVAAVGPRAPPRCDLARGPCAHPVGGATVTLDVTPRPLRAMADLTFEVRVTPGAAASRADGVIALEMPGMYMGENRVRLTPVGDGAWRGRGVLVRCPSGRRGWTAQIELPAPGAGGKLVTTFPLEVAE